MLRRLLLTLGFAGLLVALAAVGGWPDPAQSLELLNGASLTTATVSAFVVMLCWLALAGLTVAVLVNTLRPLHRLRRTASHRSLAALAAGLAVLGIGISRHADAYRVCCADPTTTQQVEQLVH